MQKFSSFGRKKKTDQNLTWLCSGIFNFIVLLIIIFTEKPLWGVSIKYQGKVILIFDSSQEF